MSNESHNERQKVPTNMAYNVNSAVFLIRMMEQDFRRKFLEITPR